MLDRSLIEAHPRSIKRPHSDDDVENDVSPPKIITPRTRSNAKVTPTTKREEDSIPKTTPRARGKTKETSPRTINKTKGTAITENKETTPRTRSKAGVITPTARSKADAGTPTTRSKAEAAIPTSRTKTKRTPEMRNKGKETIEAGNKDRERTPNFAVTKTTPRSTRSREAKNNSERTPTQVLKIPINCESSSLQKPASRTKRCRSVSPAVANSQSVRRSRSNTPVNLKDNAFGTKTSKTSNIPVLVEVKNKNVSKVSVVSKPNSSKKVDTPQSIKQASKENIIEGKRTTRTPRSQTKSPKSLHTPKGPVTLIVPKSDILDHASPDNSNQNLRRSRRSSSIQNTVKSDKHIENKNKTSKEHKANTNSSSDNNDAAKDKAKESFEESSYGSDSEIVCSQTGNDNPSSTETDGRDCTEELQKEMEKVKRRRSTLGRGRSGLSIGGRRSLCPTVPMLSLEDQISNIDKDLPQTSKVSHLLDISIREAMRRLQAKHEAEEYISDLRLELITSSESVGGHVAYKIAGLPLEVDQSSPVEKSSETFSSSDRAALLKKKTKQLEDEYKSWKSLLKERKLACQVSEREYREAKSGETKIEDDNWKNLTSTQRNILSSKPNYSDYIKEVQVAREKTFFAVQEIKHTASVISNFFKATDAVAESCYAAIEEMTFGRMGNQSLKSTIKSLLTLEEVPSA